MLKKSALIFAMLLAILLSGCTIKGTSQRPGTPNITDVVVIKPQKQQPDIEGLNEYARLDFNCIYGESAVVIYTDANKDETGQFLWDDGNWFSAVLYTSQKSYVLLEKQRLQIGCPELAVFTLADQSPVIIVTVATTASYETDKFMFDSQSGELLKLHTECYGDINYLGKL